MAVVVLLLRLVGARMMTKTNVRELADASRWLMQCASHLSSKHHRYAEEDVTKINKICE